MNRINRIGIFGAAAMALAVAAFLTVSQSTSAQAPGMAKQSRSEVVMMRCKTGGSGLAVAAYKGSAGTPGKQQGTCSDNLALLLRDGFEIKDIGHYDDVDNPFVLYTLVR
jgi:hypothetical protein